MSNFKSFKLKNNKVDFGIIASNKTKNSFVIIAMCQSKQVGYCSFSIENKTCKLSRIAVTDKDFLDKGVGSIMFNALEQFSIDKNLTTISALFIPRGYDNAWEITSKFYQKHNMTTFDCDFNYSDREEISKTPTQQPDYKLPLIINDEIFNLVNDYNYTKNDIFSSKHEYNKEQLQIEL